jgi:hypothetical protein
MRVANTIAAPRLRSQEDGRALSGVLYRRALRKHDLRGIDSPAGPLVERHLETVPVTRRLTWTPVLRRRTHIAVRLLWKKGPRAGGEAAGLLVSKDRKIGDVWTREIEATNDSWMPKKFPLTSERPVAPLAPRGGCHINTAIGQKAATVKSGIRLFWSCRSLSLGGLGVPEKPIVESNSSDALRVTLFRAIAPHLLSRS